MITVFVILGIIVAVYFISKFGIVSSLSFFYNWLHAGLSFIRNILTSILPQSTLFFGLGWVDLIFIAIACLIAWRIMVYYYVEKAVVAHKIQFLILAAIFFIIFKWF